MGFVATLLSIVGLIHVYLWKRLVRDTTRPGGGRLWGTLLILTMFGSVLAALLTRSAPMEVARWFAWPGFLMLAVMLYLFVTLLALEIPRAATLLTLRLRLRRHAAPTPPGVSTGLPAVSGDRGTTAADGAPDRAADVIAGHEQVVAEVTEKAGERGALSERPGADRGDDDAGASYLDRRRFISRGLAVVAGATAAGAVGYGTYTGLGPPQVRRVPITLPRLDAAFDGFRVAVVSDIHLGPLRGRAHTERIVRTINAARPDMIAVVGDLVDGSVAELGPAAAPLRDLEAEHGAYFVTGNHEYYAGVADWVEEIRSLGLRPLLNERVEISRGSAAFDLAGVEDLTGAEEGGGPDLTRALAGRDTGRAVVMLAHQPVLVRESAEHGVDLQLSGHTHGGQMWPFHYVVRAAQGTVAGRATVGGTELYVTRGAGFWGPPVRVGAPPEVTLIRLDAAAP